MPHRPLAALTLALASPLAVSAQEPNPLAGIELAQLSIHERIIIRIPRMRVTPVASARVTESAPVRWVEKGADKCVPAASLRAAAFNEDGDVDLVATDGRRLRAKLDDDCPVTSFYSGFYVRPAADGTICAKRDAIRSRSGAACPIEKFRMLVAKK